MTSTKIHIFGMYAPTNTATHDEKDNFYADLETQTAELPQRDLLYITSDLNARLDSRFAKFPCLEAATDNCERLRDFMESHGLLSSVCNGEAKEPMVHPQWPKGFKSRIDHCVVRRDYKSSVLDCRLLKPDAPRLGHKLMMSEMRLRYAKPKRPAVTQCRDTAAMNDPETKNTLAAEFKEVKMNNYNDFVTYAEAVLEKHLPKV